MNILVSACLMGINCRYNEKSSFEQDLNELKKKHVLIPVCPEIYGGLPTPRKPAEIIGDRVITCDGVDVTAPYSKGATEILKLAKFYDCHTAILKERSPSCGHDKIYDGTFTSTLVDGDGVTAALLKKHGITVLGESEIRSLI